MAYVDFSWSYSHYSLALQCLKKFKYVALDKIVVDSPQSSDLIFGSAIHSAINSILTNSDGQATFEIYWDSYKEKEIEYGRFNWEQLAQLGAEFLRKFGRYHAPKYQLEFAEKRLYASYRGIKIEGTPDFYGQYNGRGSLRDFKTSSRNYDEGKSDVALQLYLYVYLYLENFPNSRIDTLGYTVFNKGTGSIQDLTWEFNLNSMIEALENMRAYAEIISRAGEYPGNFNACLDYNRKCQFWDKCHVKGEKE